jgi:hypothetical protein
MMRRRRIEGRYGDEVWIRTMPEKKKGDVLQRGSCPRKARDGCVMSNEPPHGRSRKLRKIGEEPEHIPSANEPGTRKSICTVKTERKR